MFARMRLLICLAIAFLGISILYAQQSAVSPEAVNNQKAALGRIKKNPSLWFKLQKWSALMNAFVLQFFKEKKDISKIAQSAYKSSHFETLPDEQKMIFFGHYLKNASTVNDVNNYVAAFAAASPEADQFVQDYVTQQFIKMRKKQIRRSEEKRDLSELQKKLDEEKIHVNIMRYGIDAYDPVTGETALHYAIAKNKPELVKELIKNDADIMARDAEGRTPINKIFKSDRSEMLKIVFKNIGVEEGLKLYVRPKVKFMKPKKFKQDANFTKTKGQ